jgi:hypothetical protein
LAGSRAAPVPTGPLPLTSRKGINGNELYGLSGEGLSSTIARYQTLGVKWVRFDFDWSVIQPTSSTQYVFERFDAVVLALRAADINILGIITYAPAWANGGQPSKFYPPTSALDYATFAGALAKRYGPMGVHAWEIWNEPNLGQFWMPGANPAAYTALLKAAYPGIRAADPTATVITGGLAQPGNSATTMRALDFLTQIYRNGGSGFFDAVGNHPYDSPALPGVGYNWQQMYATSPSFLSVMTANGDGNKRIWMTEIGGPTSGNSEWGTVVSESVQADMLAAAYAQAASASWAGPVFWYNSQDFCTYSPQSSAECFYGVYRYDGSAKPSMIRMQGVSGTM